jgi:hypothetical protein
MILLILSQSDNPFAKVGVVGSKILTVYTSPKVASLGEAAVVLKSNDPLLMINNPASVIFANNRAVGIGFLPYWVQTYVSSVGYVHPMKRYTLGFYLHGVYSGGFKYTEIDESGGYRELGTFNYTGMVFAGVIGGRLTDKFSVALAPKLMYEGFGSFTNVLAVATDVGTLYETGFRGINIGMSVQNFGFDPRLRGDYIRYTYQGGDIVADTLPYSPYKLPLTFKAGISLDVFKTAYHSLVGLFEVNHPSDNAESFNVGFKYSYAGDLVYLALGKKFRGGWWVSPTHDELFSAGFGISILGISFDYSYTVYYRMPDVSRFGFVYTF